MIPTTFYIKTKDGTQRLIKARSRVHCLLHIGEQCVTECRPATNDELWNAATAGVEREDATKKKRKQ